MYRWLEWQIGHRYAGYDFAHGTKIQNKTTVEIMIYNLQSNLLSRKEDYHFTGSSTSDMSSIEASLSGGRPGPRGMDGVWLSIPLL